MIWSIRSRESNDVVIKVSDAFFEWLRPHVEDATVRAFDPYRDTTLRTSDLERWRAALSRARERRRQQEEERVTISRRLPREAVARKALVADWVERELSGDANYKTLLELEAALALALESGAEVKVSGD